MLRRQRVGRQQVQGGGGAASSPAAVAATMAPGVALLGGHDGGVPETRVVVLRGAQPAPSTRPLAGNPLRSSVAPVAAGALPLLLAGLLPETLEFLWKDNRGGEG